MEWWVFLLIIFCGFILLMLSGLPIAFCFLFINVICVYIFWGGLVGLQQLILSIFESVTFFAMLPVIGYLTATIPGAHSQVLFYCLSVGSAMGGNGSLIGASANMVTSGISERAGYNISYVYFLKKGFPALLITVGLAAIWLVIRF